MSDMTPRNLDGGSYLLHLLTPCYDCSIFWPSLQRSNAVDTLPASDLEAHLLFDSICTPSSPADSGLLHSVVKYSDERTA